MYGHGIKETDGMTFQNFILLLLKEKDSEGLANVNFWRSKDKAEVDFIIHRKEGITPVEVKFSDIKKATVSRSFRSFVNRYSPQTGYIVNRNYEDTITIGVTSISFVPFWKLIFS